MKSTYLLVEEAVILGPVGLQVEAEVEPQARDFAGLLQQERDDQASDASVAVEEGMDGLELHVRERSADERTSY